MGVNSHSNSLAIRVFVFGDSEADEIEKWMWEAKTIVDSI